MLINIQFIRMMKTTTSTIFQEILHVKAVFLFLNVIVNYQKINFVISKIWWWWWWAKIKKKEERQQIRYNRLWVMIIDYFCFQTTEGGRRKNLNFFLNKDFEFEFGAASHWREKDHLMNNFFAFSLNFFKFVFLLTRINYKIFL